MSKNLFCLATILIVLVLAGSSSLVAADEVTYRLGFFHSIKYNSSGDTGCDQAFESNDLSGKAIFIDSTNLTQVWHCSIDSPRTTGKPFLCFWFEYRSKNTIKLHIKCDGNNEDCIQENGKTVIITTEVDISTYDDNLPRKQVYVAYDSTNGKEFCLSVAIQGHVITIHSLDPGAAVGIGLTAVAGCCVLVAVFIFHKRRDGDSCEDSSAATKDASVSLIGNSGSSSSPLSSSAAVAVNAASVASTAGTSEPPSSPGYGSVADS